MAEKIETILDYNPTEKEWKRFGGKESFMRWFDIYIKSSPDNSACLKGVYQRTVIGPGYYKLADNGCSWGVTNSIDAVVAPYRAYIKLDKNEQIQIEYKITDL